MIKFCNDNSVINLDDGYFFSTGVFETILVKNTPVFLSKHIERLNKSIKLLNIKQTIDKLDVLNFIVENNIKNCVLKIVVSEKNIIATTRKIIYNDKDYNTGFKLKLSSVIRNSTSLLSYIKSTSYSENIIERSKAKELGYDEVLFLNEAGFISECSMSNIFWVKKDIIYTPDIKSGLLNGIIRQWIIENYNITQEKFDLKNILNADEIFITNSVMGIMKVSMIDNIFFEKSSVIENIQKDYKRVLEEL
ncbi:aminotransferase class IV [uncultured Clostridium sp.]|uniref:aminotransferase class IV n=1 Tax=uncultured Clostridium sp. TaxID=59620 RepID=UPI0026273A22|nr:aminotransferase class IV [uncultured Clostridium sp.]